MGVRINATAVRPIQAFASISTTPSRGLSPTPSSGVVIMSGVYYATENDFRSRDGADEAQSIEKNLRPSAFIRVQKIWLRQEAALWL